MTLKTFLQRLKDGDKDTKVLLQQWDQWSLDEEIEFTRLKRMSTEYSNIGGVRD